MKDKLKKVGTAIANFVKAIPSFVKSTPKKLHNLVAPKAAKIQNRYTAIS